MKITQRQINKLNKLYDEHHHISEVLSDNIKTVQDRHGEDVMEVEREIPKQDSQGRVLKDKDGKDILEKKKINLQQKLLWKEISVLGHEGHQAADILRHKYPEIWDYKEKELKIANEIKEYSLKNFGFEANKISLRNHIALTQALVKLEIKNAKKAPNIFKILINKIKNL